ncbi:hypothetical protein FRC07_010523, partial [Ceratobasidium sp. 392]
AAAAFSLLTKAARTPVPRQNPGISWFPCPDSDKTQCAFFDVPRDYSKPAGNDTVSIFMRKFPASVSKENRLGTILTNPGGPGGSGSMFVAEAGADFSELTDGRYDIIGFDPRAVNLTGPWTACFDTEANPLLLAYQGELTGAPYPHSTLANDRAVVNKLSAIQASHGAACVKNGNRKMLESSGTVFVVQDMARIVEALGEGGINYWGYSYGTVIGATFAAMRPELVKRMVLDGVSNSESYFKDFRQWNRDSMVDIPKTLTGFLSTCAEAGPKLCAFAVPPGKSNAAQTTATLRTRLNAIIDRLGKQPIVVADSPVGPGIFTASNLQTFLLGVLFMEPGLTVSAATALASIEKGDATDAYTTIYLQIPNISYVPYDNNVFNRSMQRYLTDESMFPILCGDTAPVNLSVDAYTDYFIETGKANPVGEQFAKWLGGCNGWPFRSSQRYTGPWTVAKGLKKTKFPILFMSLDADPVTPLSAAVNMSSGFGKESATLLIQQGFGHTT